MKPNWILICRACASGHGRLRVEGRTLLFVGNDGKQVSLTLDRGDDMIALAASLEKAEKETSSSPTSCWMCPPTSFGNDG